MSESQEKKKKERAKVCLSCLLTFPGSYHMHLNLHLIDHNLIIWLPPNQETVENVAFILGDLIPICKPGVC